MLLRLLHSRGCPSARLGPRSIRVPLAGLIAVSAFLAAGSATPGHAEAHERLNRIPASSATTSASATPSPTPRLKITSRPHLLVVGPMGLDVKPVAGPHFRQPPLLPTPKPVEPDPETAPANVKPQEPAAPKPPAPSEFSPDSPPALLPMEKPTPAPGPEKKTVPKENALQPIDRVEPDLKDAVMYFDTPVGPDGSRVSIPIPFGSPAPVTVPESRATYRKEKE